MFRVILVMAARVVLWVLGTLVVLSIAPNLLGWHTDVVLTGSMLPSLKPGDVIAYQPVPPDALLPGQIILVKDPAHHGHLLSHRFMRRLGDGSLITRGDANGHDDSTPVPVASLLGRGRLVFPGLGSPLMWWQQGQRGRTAATALVLLATMVVAADVVGPKRKRAEDAEAEPGTDLIAAAVVAPAVASVAEPVVEAIAQPAVELRAESPAPPVAAPVAEPAAESAAAPITEPVAQDVAEPAARHRL